jgi:hypothetical protein
MLVVVLAGSVRQCTERGLYARKQGFIPLEMTWTYILTHFFGFAEASRSRLQILGEFIICQTIGGKLVWAGPLSALAHDKRDVIGGGWCGRVPRAESESLVTYHGTTKMQL